MKYICKAMAMETTGRDSVLQELHEFIVESKQKVASTLEQLGWDAETTLKGGNSPKKIKSDGEYECSTAGNHSVFLESEMVNDLLKKKGIYSPSLNTIEEILTAEQKLALYEYCIEKTGKLTEPEISIMIRPDEGGSKKEMTFAEIVAQKRNAKRRTARYRTGAPQSYVAELRNLIDLQMSALSQYIEGETNSSTSDRNRMRSGEFRKSTERSSKPSRHEDYKRERKTHKHKKHKCISPERYKHRR
ncbi:uncharacterized protein LOC119654639 [Hermetia illucens]|uniref:uncharacterized protein LOC119654639 n=1 Tax=Hermetia illucens TaxID=343691 RepID=UPI0018CC7AA0|nr:uncharacterized protein LOC119654639 [Hermetia illucens]